MQPGKILATVLLASLVGCGGIAENPVDVTPPASNEMLRSSLNDVAQTGQLGSGGMIIEQEIENMRSTDPAKAEELSKDYQELSKARDPNAAKAKAQAMLQKL